MYQSERYMTLEVAAEVVARFAWPAPYVLEDELPDGIVVAFAACRLLLVEGFESDALIKFLPEDTGLDHAIELSAALHAVASEAERAGAPLPRPDLGLFNDASIPGSLAKLRHGVHDQCAIVLAYFRPSVVGDFRWVEAYKAHRARAMD